MNISRPKSGFIVTWPTTVADLIDAEVAQYPDFVRHWEDIIERLKFTAHREGKLEPRLGAGYRLLALGGNPSEGRPRVVVGYLVLGDSVRIRLLRISR